MVAMENLADEKKPNESRWKSHLCAVYSSLLVIIIIIKEMFPVKIEVTVGKYGAIK